MLVVAVAEEEVGVVDTLRMDDKDRKAESNELRAPEHRENSQFARRVLNLCCRSFIRSCLCQALLCWASTRA